MADNDTDLPEGTDKIIEGASKPTNSGAIGVEAGAAGGGSEGELLIEADADVAALATAGPAGRSAPVDPGVSLGAGGGGDLSTPSANAGGSAGSGGGVIDRLRSGGRDVTGQAAGKARDLVGQGLERGAEALANVGRMIGDTAAGLDERLGEEYGDYARRAASAIEGTANSLAAKDADELIEDTRNFVRKSPTVALAGAAVVGFAIARLIKSGLATGDEDDRSERSRS